ASCNRYIEDIAKTVVYGDHGLNPIHSCCHRSRRGECGSVASEADDVSRVGPCLVFRRLVGRGVPFSQELIQTQLDRGNTFLGRGAPLFPLFGHGAVLREDGQGKERGGTGSKQGTSTIHGFLSFCSGLSVIASGHPFRPVAALRWLVDGGEVAHPRRRWKSVGGARGEAGRMGGRLRGGVPGEAGDRNERD